MPQYDAIVIGGGPAGLAASIAAARAGLSVLTADVRQPPIDKLCGEGILPDGRAALSELGVDLGDEPSHLFQGISFHEDERSFAGSFPGSPGLGMRRTVLHQALARAAEREGVMLRWQTRAELSAPGLVRIGKESIRCRYIIGADGQRSLVRQAAAMSGEFASLRRRQRLATGSHYQCAPWSPFVEVHWSGRTQAYVTPVSASEVGVAFLSSDPHFRPDTALDGFPSLRDRLAGKAVIGRTQGGTSIVLRLPRVVNGTVALIGEASGSVDAITGEGLTLLFRQAIALGAALKAGRLLQYQQEHRRILRRARLMSSLLLGLGEYPRWRSRVFQAFCAEPRAFQNLLAVHIGERPRLFGEGGCAGLAGQLLFG